MLREFALDDLDELAEHIVGQSRAAVLERVRALPRGTWRYAMTLDGYDQPIELVAALTIDAGGIAVDYAGTSPVSRHGINVPKTYCEAYTGFGLACAVAPEVPNNAGSLSVFRVEAPAGCILNAPYPSPVASRHVIGQMLPDVVFGCLHQALPGAGAGRGHVLPVDARARPHHGRRRRQCPAFHDQRRAQWRHRRAAGRRRPLGHRLSFRGARHAGRDHRADLAAALPTPRAAAGLRRRRTDPRRARPDHRDRGARRRAVRDLGGARPDRRIRRAAAPAAAPAPPAGIMLDDGTVLKGKGYQEIPPARRLVVHTPGGGGYGDPRARAPAAAALDRRDGLAPAARPGRGARRGGRPLT